MKRIIVWSIGCLGTCLLAGAGCGRDAAQEGSVRARNLASGEIQTFASEGDIPAGFYKCTDEGCSVPGDLPCEQLGAMLCDSQPNCRLKVLWCMGEGVTQPGGSSSEGSAPSGTAAATEHCEVACIPKLPLSCEELTVEKECLARPDCEWGPWICPACEGCPCPSTCHSKVTPPPPPPPPAGECQSNLDCKNTELCFFKSGCGKLGPGTCQARPQACPEYYAPVCGCDGKTYGNECEARGAGTSVAHVGACTIPPPPPAGCTSNAGCGAAQFCFFKSGCGKLGPGNCMSRPQACAEYYAPVCGCDGKTYGNECEAHAAGVSVAAAGGCAPPADQSTCSALDQKYATALTAAKVCNPYVTSTIAPCQFKVATGLACPICTTFVNNTSALAALQKDWAAKGCDKLVWACPAIACAPPAGAKCAPDPSGTLGHCLDFTK